MDKIEAQLIIRKHFSYNEELKQELLQDTQKLSRKWVFFEYMTLESLLVSEIIYKRVKLGESILIHSNEWQKYHGMTVVVEKKRHGIFECYPQTNPNLRMRLSPSLIRIIPQEPKVKPQVMVGDLVLILEARFRPRYMEGDFFQVVWIGSKYVRVVPKSPRFETSTRDPGPKPRPGDGVREFSDRPNRRVYKESVYHLDIPLTSLALPTTVYGEEMGELIQGLNTIGF